MIWKDDAPYVLCLTHDVDRIRKQWYHYVIYGFRSPVVQLKSIYYKFKGKEPYWNFEELIKLEMKYGVRSTFFFLNETHKELSPNFMGRYKIRNKRVVDIIRKLDSEGFEIGLHGSYYSYNKFELFNNEKKELENILGHRVLSTRQHHLNLDKEITWQIQFESGIKYDSSLGYSKRVGKDGFFRTLQGIIEIPITLMDTVNITEEVYEECANQSKKGGVIMLNFHQCHFNSAEYPQNVEIYNRLLNKAKDDKAWITNVGELGDWINERI